MEDAVAQEIYKRVRVGDRASRTIFLLLALVDVEATTAMGNNV